MILAIINQQRNDLKSLMEGFLPKITIYLSADVAQATKYFLHSVFNSIQYPHYINMDIEGAMF